MCGCYLAPASSVKHPMSLTGERGVRGGGCMCVWLLPSPCLLSEAPHVVDRGEQRQVVFEACEVVFLPVAGGSMHQTSACIKGD